MNRRGGLLIVGISCLLLVVVFRPAHRLVSSHQTYWTVASTLDLSAVREVERIQLPLLSRGLSRDGFVIVDRRTQESTLIVFEHWTGKGRNFSGLLCVIPREGEVETDVYIHMTTPRPRVREPDGFDDMPIEMRPTDTPLVFEVDYRLD